MQATEFAQWTIVVLTTGILLLPLRYAYFALILLGFFDASGPSFASASAVGTANTMKIIGAPVILLIRTKLKPLSLIRRAGVSFWLFAGLGFYALLALLWSDWVLSGIKMVAYLYGYILWFLILAYGYRESFISAKLLWAVLWLGIVTALAQTYLFGNQFGEYIPTSTFRLTAFSGPQSFAAFLVCIGSLIVFSHLGLVTRLLTLIAVAAALIGSGSRYATAGFLFILILAFVKYLRESHSFHQSIKRWTAGMAVVVLIVASISPFLPQLANTRVGELVHLFNGQYEEIGTLAWRLGMYDVALDQMSGSSASTFLFGQGTSEGANVALAYNPRKYSPATVDANRVVHNEFIKAMYEWGVVGVLLLVWFTIALISVGLRYLVAGRPPSAYSFSAVVPLLMGGLLIENVLAGAGTPVGIGMVLVLARLFVDVQYAPMVHYNRY